MSDKPKPCVSIGDDLITRTYTCANKMFGPARAQVTFYSPIIKFATADIYIIPGSLAHSLRVYNRNELLGLKAVIDAILADEQEPAERR